jgi:hypothetical protein
MGIFDRLKKPFSKSKETPRVMKDIDGGLPEDLVQFRRNPLPEKAINENITDNRIAETQPKDFKFEEMGSGFDDSFDEDDNMQSPFSPPPSEEEPVTTSGQKNYIPPEFGISSEPLKPPTSPQPVQPSNLQHSIELILSRLETIDARLRVIEERTRR